MKIKLKISMIRKLKDENYFSIYDSDYAIFDYIILRYIAKKNTTLITTPKIMYKYFIDKEPNSKEIKNIKQGLDILLQNDIIYYNVSKRNYIIETDGLDFDSSCNKYFNIEPDYIRKVVNCHNGIKLLHYYITLCSTINVITNYGFRSQEDLSKLIKINIKTIRNYNALLKDLNVICFSKHQNTVDKNGNFINLPKLYTFPEYADIIDTEQKDIMNKAKIKANKKKKVLPKLAYPKVIPKIVEENENPFE